METGAGIRECHRRHRTSEFRKFLDTIGQNVPAAWDVHLILDNYGTHTTAAIYPGWPNGRGPRALHPHERLLDQLGGALVCDPYRDPDSTRRPPERASTRHGDQRVLGDHQPVARPFVWAKAADEILASVARFCARTRSQDTSIAAPRRTRIRHPRRRGRDLNYEPSPRSLAGGLAPSAGPRTIGS